MRLCKIFFIYGYVLSSVLLAQERLNVAVASNFLAPMQQLKVAFENRYPEGVEIDISHASSQKLANQIILGAPYDLFLSADEKSVNVLIQKNIGQKDTVFVYALGHLLFWSPDSQSDSLPAALKACQKMTLANPKLAPYGLAAQQVLDHYQVDVKKITLLFAQNVNQSLQFVRAQPMCAFLAQSQATYLKHQKGKSYQVDSSLHAPIRQQVIAITQGKPVIDFLNFLKSKEAKDIIKSYGYRIEEQSFE